MKYSMTALALGATLPQVWAFPHMDRVAAEIAASAPKKRDFTKRDVGITGNNVPDPSVVLGFDAKKQYIDTTGKHEWRAAGPNDQRGPCPGLNALANHGYLPRSGVASNLQLIQATNQVYGMGLDLSVFLAVIGDLFDGNAFGWSIGSSSLLVPGGNGLTGSHNKYDNDGSLTRGDLYQYGTNEDVIWKQWEQVYAAQKDKSEEESNYNLKVYQELRSSRWDQSVSENPYYFLGPFSGIFVQPAGATFPFRYMANKSEEHPEGQLTKSVLKSFFGVTEHEDGSFSGGRGYERIPDNWYRRAFGAEYGIAFFVEDVLQEASVYPKFLNLGGNEGKVNTFSPIDLRDPAGGVIDSARLLEGNNLMCFVFQSLQNAAPDQLISLTSLIGKIGGPGASSLTKTIQSLGCPQLYNISKDVLKKYPGYSKTSKGLNRGYDGHQTTKSGDNQNQLS
jgi:hypothetical protein